MRIEKFSINHWIESVDDKKEKEFREAVHVILSAISNDESLRPSMVMKGGILLAFHYESRRFTKDIDFSSPNPLNEEDIEKIRGKINSSFKRTAILFEYDLDCRVQSCKILPSNKKSRSFPSLQITVGYAYKGETKHRRLLKGNSPTSVKIDYSFNEPTLNIESIKIGADNSILVYTLIDLIAEKLRSLLQQVIRNRNRRQDIFDLYHIFLQFPDISLEDKEAIFTSFLRKSKAGDLNPNKDSIDHPDVRSRAMADYGTFTDEIEGEIPEFNMAFEKIKEFYHSLPWS